MNLSQTSIRTIFSDIYNQEVKNNDLQRRKLMTRTFRKKCHSFPSMNK